MFFRGALGSRLTFVAADCHDPSRSHARHGTLVCVEAGEHYHGTCLYAMSSSLSGREGLADMLLYPTTENIFDHTSHLGHPQIPQTRASPMVLSHNRDSL